MPPTDLQENNDISDLFLNAPVLIYVELEVTAIGAWVTWSSHSERYPTS